MFVLSRILVVMVRTLFDRRSSCDWPAAVTGCRPELRLTEISACAPCALFWLCPA